MSGRVFLIFCVLLCCLFHSCRCNDHVENVALNKPCSMSSILHWSHPANAAVNGDTAMKYEGTTNCVHSGWGDTSPWWEVNLGRKYPVHGMSVWPREGFGRRISNSVITVDGEICYEFQQVSSNINREIAINCSGGVMNGSVVRLARNGTAGVEDSYFMNMCEFQVFSCSARYWGSDCGQGCGNCRNGACDKVTGHCDSGCQPGWKSPLCAECSDGFFGQDCQDKCSMNCASSPCDKTTGYCLCKPGFMPTNCETECPDGFYGQDCIKTCSKNCATSPCDKVTGNCTCNPGWMPPSCSETIQQAEGTVDAPLTAVIAGSVSAGVVFIVVAVVFIVFVARRCTHWNKPDDVNTLNESHATSDHTNPVYQNVGEGDSTPVSLPDTAGAAPVPHVTYENPALDRDSGDFGHSATTYERLEIYENKKDITNIYTPLTTARGDNTGV